MAQGIFLHEYNTGGKLYDGAVTVANNKLANKQYVIDNAALQSNNLSDLDDAGTARTNLGLAIGSNVQAYHARLAELSGLATTNNNFIVADGSSFTLETPAQARTSLGLAIGSDVQAYDAQLADIAGLTPDDGKFIVGDGSNFTVEDGATARASLGLTIGTNVQAYDAQLADIAALTPTDGNIIIGDGNNFVLESGATARTSLGLGTSATQDTGIGSGDVLAAAAGVADDDFLRVAGTTIEGLSAAEVLAQLSGAAGADFSVNSQKITNVATPTADTDAANKAYVDSSQAGLDVKESVRCATTANIDGTYSGAAITVSPAGVLTVDGVVTALNDRILLKDQTGGSGSSARQEKYNGIYKVTTAGAAATGTGPQTGTPFTAGDYQYNNFVSTQIGTTNFDRTSGFDASTTQLDWSSYSGASFQIDHRSIIVIKTYGGNLAYRMTANPAGFSFSNGSAAALPLDGQGLVTSHSTTTSIPANTYVIGIDVYEPKSAGPEFSLDDVLNGTINQNTTSISLKTSGANPAYFGWEGDTLSAPFYIEVADSSSNKWYWKVTSDVSSGDSSIDVEFDEDDSHNATPSFNLGTDFGSAHSAGDIDFFASGSGGSATAAVLTRASDFDASSEVTAGAFTFVAEGTSNADKGFVLTTNDTITLNTTSLAFSQFSGAGSFTAGDGIQQSGNSLSADLKANGGLVIESGEIAVDLSGSSITGTLALGDGGTGSTTASGARTALGLGSIATQASNSVTITGGSISGITPLAVTDGGTGSATASAARTALGLTIGSDVQAYDAQLDTLAGYTAAQVTRGIADENLLTVDDADAADNDYAKFTANGIEGRSFSEVKTDLGLVIGTDVQAYDAQLDTLAGYTAAQVTRGIANENLVTVDDADAADNDYAKFTANGIEGRSFSEVRTDLGLVIGTNVQAYDAGLQSISGLSTGANEMIFTTGSDTYATTTLSAFARTLLDDADAATMRATLGAAGTDSTELSVDVSEPSSIAIGDVDGMYVYDISSNSTALTVDLPSTATAGCLGKSVIFKIKSTVGSSSSLTISGQTNQSIDGEASIVLNQERQSIKLVISEEHSSGATQCWVVV